MEILDILLSASFWAAAVRIASPLIFATMGELICERAGVLNLGIEGMMATGAAMGFVLMSTTGSYTLGFLGGAALGLRAAFHMVRGRFGGG